MKRLECIDIARGRGIIFVVIAHTCGFIVGGMYLTACYIPLFFVISGYLYCPDKPYFDDILKHVKSLLIPYFS